MMNANGGFVDNPVDAFTPDVPPRNLSMGRGNSIGHGRGHSASDREADFEPTCLTRTPSGTVLMSSDIPKNSSPQHKPDSPCNSPKKGDSLKTNPDRCQPSYTTTVLVPNVPVRNNLRRPTSNHFSHSRFQLRKTLPSRCSWKCTAILFICLTVVLSTILTYFAAMNMLRWQQGIDKPCFAIPEDLDSTAVTAPELNSTYLQSISHKVKRALNVSAPGPRVVFFSGSHEDPTRSRSRANATLIRPRRAGNIPKVYPKPDQMSVQVSSEIPGSDSNTTKSSHNGQHLSDDARRYSEIFENDPPVRHPPIATYLETIEGSGVREIEQSDSPSLENSISPFLHPKNDENRTLDAVSKATVSMVTNVIDETISGQPLRGSDHGEQHSEAQFSEEGFIPVISNQVSRNNITTNIRKPFSSIDDFNDSKTTHASHGSTSTSGVSSSDVDDHKAAITELPSYTYVSSSPPDLPPPPPPPPQSLQPLPEYVLASETLTSNDNQCMCSCPCSTASAVVFSMPSPSSLMVQPSSVESEVSPRQELTEPSNNQTLSFIVLDHDPNITNYHVIDSNLEVFNDSDFELNTSDIDISRNLLPDDGLKLNSTIPTPPLTQLPDTSLSAATNTGAESVEINTTITPSQYDEGLSTVQDMVLITEVPTNAVKGPTPFPAKTLPPDGSTFLEISLNRRGTNDIPPYGHWNARFHQPRTAFVRFNYTIPKDASIGVYGRRNAIPTHTQHDFMEILSDEEKRRKRNLKDTINIVFVQYLDAGQWFLSMYNDDNKLQDVSFITAIADDLSIGCPYDCHDHGTCVRGVCQCYPGFTGHDCSRSVCPVLCAGNGEYLNGHCLCKPGWKGRECNLRYDECEIPGCNGHGQCIDGKCRCAKGYKGEFCELVDCLVPDCSGHGVCVTGSCICHRGWKGDACDDIDSEVRKCLPDCSGHGKFDLEKVKCACDAKWTGSDCSKELCDMDCGPYGRCESGKCHCDEGWSGSKCDVKTCDPRCHEHGQCKNGTCICIQGWNGRHCTLDGCSQNCFNHGECLKTKDGNWICQCADDWEGADCSIPLERNCNDGKDNDGDGLIDCEDSECCPTKSCTENLVCITTADPLEVLLKKQPPAVTASFFQRMRFLIEEDSVQNYVRKNAFNESRASVIRGRVVSPTGSGIVGIRVSTSNSQEGFTLTRQSGWFDLMVNGGGAVTLQFQRHPFRIVKEAMMVPWNEVIIINNVVMTSQETTDVEFEPDPCPDHDYDGMKPVVLATWKHEFLGGCPEKSTILAESQVLQESLTIPGTDLHLVYHSSRSAGYMSTIQLQLTPDQIPKSLRLIHLRISIEGILFEKVFEADPGLKYTYAWNRRNVYRQRVYGVTTASVSVGFEYSSCKTIIWDIQTTKLSGHDMSISDIGGWNFDIHHRYNFHEGILQKGDGTNIYLRYKPRVLLTIMGNGMQRPLECQNCNGVAFEQRLVAPVALAASPDGSLYVGDFDLIRRILPDRTVQTVLKLNLALVSYRYHLTVSPVDGMVYLSDPERHQIIRIKAIEDIPELEKNFEVVIGSGARCLPGDKNNCGDGGLAKDAKLMYPKGVVFSADGLIYFADGINIRVVDKKGYIRTLIGNHRHKGHWKPIPCHGTLNLDEVHLRWPTELAINPLDGSLHIIDDHMILRLSQDGRIKVIAGQPLHCPSHGGNKDSVELASHTTLIFPESISFAPTGELYIAESDSQRINRIRVIGTDGKISDFAGVESKCNCLERDCKCFDEDHFLASLSKLNTISSIAVTPDGIVHIADQGNLRIRSVIATLPESNRLREFEIYSPETQEIYVFNRYGLHVATRNILTNRNVYSFTYNLNTSFGKLSSITDATGNKIFMLRDYSNMVNTIENTHGQKVRLGNTRMKMLQDFITPGSYNVTFDYHGSTGLLKSKRDSLGQSFLYQYDENGRLTEAVTPSGEIVQLTFDLSVKGAEVMVTRDKGSITSMLIKGLTVTTKQGLAESQIIHQNDGGVTLNSPWKQSIITETTAYPILADIDPVLGESFPVPSRQKILIQDELVHRLEWRYYVRKGGKGRDKHVSQVIRKMKVNGDYLLAVEFDRDNLIETLFDHNQVALLSINYDAVGRPERYVSAYNITSVELKYDRFGRLAEWHRGDLNERYGFDREGRMNEIQYSDGSSVFYKFKDQMSGLPCAITLPSGKRYTLQYDDTGSLHSIITPRGHVHEFGIQTSLGFYKLQYMAPSMRQPFIIQYNDRGELLAKIYPGLKGRVSYTHDADGKLQAIFFGDSKIEYFYYKETGLVKAISIDASGFECRTDYKYHGALVKEEKLRFGSKLGLNGVKIKYQYDGNAQFQRYDLEIKEKEEYQVNYNYNANTGILEGFSQFVIKRNNFNEHIIESQTEQFIRRRILDRYGRIADYTVLVAGKQVYWAHFTYDTRDRVQQIESKMAHSAAVTSKNYSYTVDGLLEEVVERDTWKYRHDENGNIIGIIIQGKEDVKLRYNEGDRLIAYGDYDMNIIDNRGFLVQKGEEKFLYNARSQLMSAARRNLYEVHYHYDSFRRLIVRKDTQGNITQYFYTDLRQPNLVTHIHHPKSSNTFKLAYDDNGHMIYLEHGNSNTKYFVATDHVGSPLAVFDVDGNVVKEIHRSPFGALLEDTNIHFYLPVDFHGGLRDPITGLIHFGDRVYDPNHTQWMTPDWENILDYVTTPQAMYPYRFHNNDPINLPQSPQTSRYYTELTEWLPLFNYDIKDISGMANVDITQGLLPRMPSNLPVISGLGCSSDVVRREFLRLSFVPATRVRSDTHFKPKQPPITRKKSVFGDGILVSRLNGKALVNVLEGGSQIVQDVMMSVLNNTYFLDIHFISHGQDVFHFVKEGAFSKVQDDHIQLQRLSGVFNVTVHDSEHGKDLKLYGHSATINIRYGTTVEQERHRLLKQARKRAVDHPLDGGQELVVDNLSRIEMRRRRSGRRKRKGRQEV